MKQLFDKFEILEVIKKDGGSSVYLAKHIYLSKKIVLKILEIPEDQNSEDLQRFKREARILAQLDHPNIIQVLDFGMSEQQAYLSFEYFESEDLRAFIEHERPNQKIKSQLFTQLLQGLHAAHQGNVIHRDLKPENILINKNGQLKIADFGLAILQDETKVTNKSSIVGTPAYMSPEQIRGEPLLHNSDLFALGIIGFELFYGYNPFTGKDINSTINAILSFDELSLFKQVPALESPIPEILKKLLRHTPSDRGSATEILSLLGAEPIESASTHRRKNRALKPALVIFLILSAVTISWLAFVNENKKPVEVEPVRTDLFADTTTPEALIQDPIMESAKKANSLPGFLAVEVHPEADLFLNGRLSIAASSSKTLKLQPGYYEVQLVREGYPAYVQMISIKEDDSVMIRVNLDSLFGYFLCQVHPWGDVHINDQYIGQTPLFGAVKLVPGKHGLRVENPNFSTYQDSFDVQSGETTELRINLEIVSGSGSQN